MIAIENNDIKIINYLLTNNKQIDVNVQTKYNGYTALHLPFLGNKMDDNATKQMILLLIKYKTIQLLPDYKTKQTPLHLAVVSNQNELCLKMIKIYFNNHKNDIDVLNQQSLPHKHTILHLSAIKNYINLCKLLLKLGANPFLKNIKNETFYETAKKYGHEGIVEVYNEMDEKDKEKFEQIEIIGEENKEKDEQKEEEKSLYSTQELRKRLAEKSNHNSNNYNNKYLQPQPHIHPNNCLVTNVNILPLKQNINNNYSFMNGNNTTINQRNSNKNQHTKTKVKSTNKSRKAFEPGHPKFERALQQLIEMRQKHAQGLLPSVRQFMKTIHMGFPNTNAVLKYYSNNYLNMTLDDFKRDYMVIGRVIGRPKKTNRYDYYDTSDSDTDSDSPQTNGCNNNNNNNNNSNLKTEEENSDVEMSLKCQNKNTGGTI
eukprot:494109_1